jgi:uncharacterized membrane protein
MAAALAVAATPASTAAWASAPGRAVVGASTGLPTLGFVRDQGSYRTIEIPGALTLTIAAGIDDTGRIVGHYDDAGGRYGFLIHGATFTKIRVPGADRTEAFKVNSSGQVVGYYIESLTTDPDTRGGYLFDRSGFTKIEPRLAVSTQAIGINDLGQVVGAYIDKDGVEHGFLRDRGRFTTIDAPNSFDTVPTGINNQGQIVGFTSTDFILTSVHGFLLAEGAKGPFTPIDVPDSPATAALGINDGGQIVGSYQNPNAGQATGSRWWTR